jgi:aminopeptidase N
VSGKLPRPMPFQHRLHQRCRCSSHAHAGEHALGQGAARPFAFATTQRQFERDRPFGIERLAVALVLDILGRSVEGVATLDVARIDPGSEELELDAVGFQLHEVTVDGKAIAARYDGKTIAVPLPRAVERATVVVKYRAQPRRGMYFLSPDSHYPNRPHQVWTQCQEEDARHFIPCHDKPHVKMKVALDITAPNGWTVLSNGDLQEKSTPATGPWRFVWKMDEPVPSYLLTVVAGEFATIEATAALPASLPLQYLFPPGREADGERTFARTPQMIEHFGKLTGTPYPWSKYAQVVVSDFIFGGMENTSATTMYEHILLDARAALDISSDDLVAHELAHQWFGDYVTCRDWSEAWLNEGFATYFEHVWRDEHLGRDEYFYGIRGDLGSYLAEAHGRYRRPIVCQDYDAPLDLFDRHLYEKGGLVLHALRTDLGDALFWKGIQVYLARHARGLVETRDLLRAFEEVSGRSLGRFFEQALYRAGHPEWEVTIGWDKGAFTVSVKQQQAVADGVPAVFELPLYIELVGPGPAGETRKERFLVTQRQERFAIPCPVRPAFAVVDPEMRLVGDITVKGPADMLRAQLVGGKDGRARWLAAQALGQVDDPVTVEALTARLHDEREFWGVRAESAEALGRLRGKESFLALEAGLRAAHPKVRRAVVDALGRFKTVAAAELLRPIALEDPSYVVEAEAARALGKTRQPSAFDTLLDLLERPSWADVIRVGAIDGLAALRDDRATPHLLARTRYGQPNRARRAAILALPKIAFDRRTREALEELLDDGDPHLRIDAVRALVELGDGKARAALSAKLSTDLDARVRRRLREALRDLGDGKRTDAGLREELDKVTSEQLELKSRLAQLEARLNGGAPAKPAAPASPPAKTAKKTAAAAKKATPARSAKKKATRR